MSTPDLLIIGGGVAGLSAAAAACNFGLSVEIIDERATFGGNLYPGSEERSAGDATAGLDHARGMALLANAKGATANRGTFAWRVERSGQTFVISEAMGVRSITPRRVLIATGAMERPVPVPGGLLPGVMYAGAAQLMLKSSALVPTGRVVLVGGGPLLLLLATQLLAHGVPTCIVETTPRVGLGAALAMLSAALNAPEFLSEGAKTICTLHRAGIPWHRHATKLSIEGSARAERVVFTNRHGKREAIAADLVLLHDGIVPNDHATRQLGCEERWNAGQHCFNPVVDQWGETSQRGVFAAGDCTGIWGALAAELSGEIAVLEIARQLGKIDVFERDERARRSRRKLVRQRRFRPFLEALYPPSVSAAGRAAAETVICRCENVTAGAIRRAVAHGATGPDQLKSFTRCGMGPCQGRTCSLAVAEVIAAELGSAVEAVGRHEIRAPLKPLPLGRLAQAEAAESTR